MAKTDKPRISGLMETLERRDAVVRRFVDALAHLPRKRAIAIIVGHIPLDEAERIAEFLDRRT